MSGDSDWLIILLLLIPTSTMWFSLDSPYNCDSDSLPLAREDHLYRGGTRGRVQGVCPPQPPEMTYGFLIQQCSAKYADMYDMYSQQFTLRYCFFVFPFEIYHQPWIHPCFSNSHVITHRDCAISSPN